jgi:hypothetical protein
MTARIDPPADCAQPADHGPSYYLTLRPRTFAEAVRDVSRVRDLPDWIWSELQHHRHTAVVIDMADARRARRAAR